MKKIRIAGAGCSLIDNLYNNIDFESKSFTKYLAKTSGDGGLSPGKLVFVEEFEEFSKRPINESLIEITGGKNQINSIWEVPVLLLWSMLLNLPIIAASGYIFMVPLEMMKTEES
ncbi:MAG: hypothetical protein HC906_01540 [Bacteroidales bacterium]|nr:hypothetical protein [Bacteroidales bacterium]